MLEYATGRAGDLLRFGDKELGLGVVNPRTGDLESRQGIRRAVEKAARLNCGFGTFSNRPMNTTEVATAKLRAMDGAARDLRESAPGVDY